MRMRMRMRMGVRMWLCAGRDDPARARVREVQLPLAVPESGLPLAASWPGLGSA
jgi:hypothetical protein